MIERYFDNAATTPLDPRVRDAMLPYLEGEWGNANSIHSLGLRAGDAVERAREQVALLIGAEDPSQIFFTSGATESNNWVCRAADELWISPFEHSAMHEPAMRKGARLLENDGLNFDNRSFEQPDTLVSVMAVNNEIGTIWDVRDFHGALLHSDATQAFGKIPISVEDLDFSSGSAHKFYGPKGIGFLYCRDQTPDPLIVGGDQERGLRAGTLNVAAIVGLGAAASLASAEQPEDFAYASTLKAALVDGLKDLPDTRYNGGDRTSPFILSVSFYGVEGEAIVLELDRVGYSISAGAACSSRSLEPSRVLTALRVEPAWLRGTIRISFGRFNTEVESRKLAKNLCSIVEMLRTL